MSRVIDAHVHVWGPATNEWLKGLPIDREFDFDDFCSAVNGTPVEGAMLVEVQASDAETDALIAVKREHAEYLGVVAWVDLADPLVGHRLDEIGAELSGVRRGVHDDADGSWFHRPDVANGMRELAHAGLAFDLLVRRPHRVDAAMFAHANPDVRFVLDHAGKPEIDEGEWDEWVSHLRALADLDNITCKLSGLAVEASWTRWREQDVARYFDTALEIFGAERCMWASNWPVCLVVEEYIEEFEFATQQLAGLSVDERAAVFGGTAERVYRL